MKNLPAILFQSTFTGMLLCILMATIPTKALCDDIHSVGAEFMFDSESKSNQRFPAIAYGGGIYLVVWQDGWNGVGGDSQIKGAIVRGTLNEAKWSLKVEKKILICSAPDHQEVPQIYFSGGNFLVVWHDFRNGKDADVYGTRITPEGKVLDPDGIPIAVRNHNQNFPVLCGNGQDFLVAWREIRYGQTYDLMATRIESKTGKVLDENALRIADDVSLPAIGFTGKHYIIAWVDNRKTRKLQFCRYDPITLKRVESEPNTVGCPDAFGYVGQMKLISGTDEVLAVWARGIRPDPWGWGGPGAILAMRLKDDGSAPESKAYDKIRWSPEGRTLYVDRILPGVLDCAHWKGLPGWPQGKPGGFKEAEGGIWPYAFLTAVAIPQKQGQFAVAWVRSHLEGTSHTSIRDIEGGRVKSGDSLDVPDAPPLELIAGSNATLPALSAGTNGEPLLLIYEGRNDEGQSLINGRFVTIKPIQ